MEPAGQERKLKKLSFSLDIRRTKEAQWRSLGECGLLPIFVQTPEWSLTPLIPPSEKTTNFADWETQTLSSGWKKEAGAPNAQVRAVWTVTCFSSNFHIPIAILCDFQKPTMLFVPIT